MLYYQETKEIFKSLNLQVTVYNKVKNLSHNPPKDCLPLDINFEWNLVESRGSCMLQKWHSITPNLQLHYLKKQDKDIRIFIIL